MSEPSVTFITTCRGRLAHLKESLPRMLAQPGVACVVVDYDCPEHAGDWVEAHHPAVTVVRSGPRPRFEPARARNLGAQAARTPWLCFADADTLVSERFGATLFPALAPGGYYLVHDNAGSLTGLCICMRQDFSAVGGYDGVLQGWGMEDKDFYQRLTLAGLERRWFPQQLVDMIAHGDDLRVQHYAIKNRRLSSTANFAYCRAKWDLLRLGSDEMADESKRETLYGKVLQGMQAAMLNKRAFVMEIPLGTDPTFSGSLLRATMRYEVVPARTTTVPSGTPSGQ